MNEVYNQGSNPAQVTVGATSVQLLPPRVNRTALVFRNSSTAGQIITISESSGLAVSLSGIVLAAGQAWVENTSEGFRCWDGSVQVISDAAGATLSYFER